MSKPPDDPKVISGARATVKINGQTVGVFKNFGQVITDPPWDAKDIIKYDGVMSAEMVARSFRFVGIVGNPIKYWLRRKSQW